MVKCFNDKKCHGYHEHCDPHLPHCGEDCACCTMEPFCGEKDILSACPVPVCPCNPCWDNCRCTEEIKKLKTKTDEIDNFDGRLTKVEKDIVDFNQNLTQQIGDLAEKEQADVDNLQSQIDNADAAIRAEVARATAAENDLNDRLNKEIRDRIADVDQEEARANAAESGLDNKIEAETAARIADVNAEEHRAIDAETLLDHKIQSETTARIADVDNEQNRATTAEQNLNNKIDGEIANRKADAIASAEYNKNDVKIYFKNKNGQTISTIDAKDFIVDGMVNRVYINNRELVIEWNADAGIQTTRIPLDQIFNPDNYYTKTQVNGLIGGVNDRIDTSNQNIANVSDRVDSLSATVSEHTTSINNLNNTVSRNTTNISKNADDIADLKADVAGHSAAINSLNSTVAGNTQSINNLNNVVSGHTTQINNLGATVGNYSAQIENLNNTVGNHTTRINNMGQSIDDLLARVAALEQLWYNNNGVITAVGGKPVLTTGTSTAGGFYDSTISA